MRTYRVVDLRPDAGLYVLDADEVTDCKECQRCPCDYEHPCEPDTCHSYDNCAVIA